MGGLRKVVVYIIFTAVLLFCAGMLIHNEMLGRKSNHKTKDVSVSKEVHAKIYDGFVIGTRQIPKYYAYRVELQNGLNVGVMSADRLDYRQPVKVQIQNGIAKLV